MTKEKYDYLVSLSGGRTSMFMAKLLKDQGYKVLCVFMNTGLEHLETYRFLKQGVELYDLDLVCLEAHVYHGQRIGTSYNVVPFHKMHRGTKIAAEVVKKYGIFGMGYLHCTREMKLSPFQKFKKDHYPELWTAIGIRVDEMDRMVSKADKEKLFYPLVKAGITKDIIDEHFQNEDFDLNIPDYLGNCVGCWKKSNNKLIKAVKEAREEFLKLRELEKIDSSRDMFRGRRRVSELIIDAELDELEKSDVSSGCDETCEVFSEDSLGLSVGEYNDVPRTGLLPLGESPWGYTITP